MGRAGEVRGGRPSEETTRVGWFSNIINASFSATRFARHRRLKELEKGGKAAVQGMRKYAVTPNSAIGRPWRRDVEREKRRLKSRMEGAAEGRRRSEDWLLNEMEGGLRAVREEAEN